MTLEPQILQILKELGNTHYGNALRVVLKQKKDDLNNVLTAKNEYDYFGRKDTVKFIEEVESFLDDSKKNPPKKNQYE